MSTRNIGLVSCGISNLLYMFGSNNRKKGVDGRILLYHCMLSRLCTPPSRPFNHLRMNPKKITVRCVVSLLLLMTKVVAQPMTQPSKIVMDANWKWDASSGPRWVAPFVGTNDKIKLPMETMTQKLSSFARARGTQAIDSTMPSCRSSRCKDVP